MTSFAAPDGAFAAILHAGASADTRANAADPAGTSRTILEGTARVLNLANSSGAKRFLFVSSGAVYGRQPPMLTRVPETFAPAAPDPSPGHAYAQSKLAAERLCGDRAVVARGFAFSGPGIPLDGPFAFGNFLRDILRGVPIRILSDGTAVRSYLHASDLAVWLWTLLARGEAGRPYNVGSEAEISVTELARRMVARLMTGHPIEIAKAPSPGIPPDR